MPGSSKSARAGAYNTRAYRRARAELLAGHPPCIYCGREAEEPDHVPPLTLHDHVPGSDCCVMVPSCADCARRQGAALRNTGDAPRARETAIVEPDAVPLERFDVPWLAELLDVPADATWPRLMTAPHPLATGSYGELVEASSLELRGVPLLWWQRLAVRRLLEHNAEGRLLWRISILTVARQVGKSWLLGDIHWWRMHAGELLDAVQTVVATGKDLGVLREVERPLLGVAMRNKPLYKPSLVNGYEGIERRSDGSRLLVRAQSAVYGLSATLATVDEGWSVPASVVDDGLEPTTVNRTDAQILLISTAHRRATALMVGRRARALQHLGDGEGPLLLEWSAPPDADLDDREAWRLASPHWTPLRERIVAERLEGALSGESEDVDEPDPLASFRTQWLNQWPTKRTKLVKGELLVELEEWNELAGDVVDDPERIYLAVEDHGGLGAAIAAVVRHERHADGELVGVSFHVDGWTVPTWEAALADLRSLLADHDSAVLVAGASIRVRLPRGMRAESATSAFTRTTLPLVRELVAARAIVHDSDELAGQIESVRVTEAIGGLAVVAGYRSDLLRAFSWALAHAHRPRRSPSVR